MKSECVCVLGGGGGGEGKEWSSLCLRIYLSLVFPVVFSTATRNSGET